MIYCAVSSGFLLLKDSLKRVWIWLALHASIQHQWFCGGGVILWRSHWDIPALCTRTEYPGPGTAQESWSWLCWLPAVSKASPGLAPGEIQWATSAAFGAAQPNCWVWPDKPGWGLVAPGRSQLVHFCMFDTVSRPEKQHRERIFFCTVMVKTGVCWLFWLMTSTKYLIVGICKLKPYKE